MRSGRIQKSEKSSWLGTSAHLYLAAVLSGDWEQARSIARRALAENAEPRRVYTTLILPVQQALADGLSQGQISPEQERAARDFVLQEMEQLRRLIAAPTTEGLVATVTSIGGEHQALGAQLVADLLTFDGWQVDCVPPVAPGDGAVLMNSLAARPAQLVALALSAPHTVVETENLIARLKKQNASTQVMVIGGMTDSQALPGAPHIEAWAANAEEAVLVARRMAGARHASLGQLLTTVGSRVQRRRKERGLSQSQVARVAGVDRAYLSSIENGKQNITLAALLRIADALETPVDSLLRSASE